MNYTLKEQLEKRLNDISNRINQLEIHINQYILNGELIEAAIHKTKRETLIMVYEDLKSLLSN
jgi:cell division protein FtsB